MSLPRYPAYEKSGVEWLGEVPTHWSVSPLKHLADFVNGDAFKPTDWAESGMPIIRIQNLNGGEEFNHVDGEVEARYLVREGDLLFGWSGNRGTSFGPFMWLRPGVFALNQHIFKVLPRGTDRRALYWTLKAVTTHVEQQAHGIIGMVHVTKGNLGSICVPVPPPHEYERIALFLDRETAKIDALIAEQERLVALLDEKRHAVITQAVTKGLDPSVPMKESGVEWIGKIPSHWKVGPARFVLKEPPRYGVLVPDSVDVGVSMLRITDIEHGQARRGDLTVISRELSDQYPRTVLAEGDVVLSVVGTVGECLVVDEELAGVNLSRALARLVPSRAIAAEYLRWYLNSVAFKHFVDLICTGTAQRVLNMDDLRAHRMPLPPVEEQVALVAELERALDPIERLAELARVARALLLERRAALITAAVTGQIDVRGLVDSEAE